MTGLRKSVLAVLFLSLAAPAAALAGPERSDDLAARLDRIFAEAYPATGPGVAVIVVQDGKPILRKGYGLANVELSVPITPEMVFRIGSVTKQFTAAAILKLVEAGRLSLSDEIGRFLPDFPTRGKKMTVEQLLTHTSGIKSVTGMPSWSPRMREDWTPAQIIAFFQNEPLDFEPGTKWKYNNSGYHLLGAIIEKVSGKKYEDFVAEAIFRPLGMERTRYGSDAPIIPGRVEGYQRTPGGIINAPYVSMTQPYSAGALVSTVDDLARWQAALDRDGFLSAESRRRMWTPVTLPDGTATRYGFGWGIWKYKGHGRRARRRDQRVRNGEHALARRPHLCRRALQHVRSGARSADTRAAGGVARRRHPGRRPQGCDACTGGTRAVRRGVQGQRRRQLDRAAQGGSPRGRGRTFQQRGLCGRRFRRQFLLP